jgi:hypothetical protein
MVRELSREGFTLPERTYTAPWPLPPPFPPPRPPSHQEPLHIPRRPREREGGGAGEDRSRLVSGVGLLLDETADVGPAVAEGTGEKQMTHETS